MPTVLVNARHVIVVAVVVPVDVAIVQVYEVVVVGAIIRRRPGVVQRPALRQMHLHYLPLGFLAKWPVLPFSPRNPDAAIRPAAP